LFRTPVMSRRLPAKNPMGLSVKGTGPDSVIGAAGGLKARFLQRTIRPSLKTPIGRIQHPAHFFCLALFTVE
jgi:hypothetical protein